MWEIELLRNVTSEVQRAGYPENLIPTLLVLLFDSS